MDARGRGRATVFDIASKDIATIAKELSRTQTAIRRKASKLKLTLKVVTLELRLKAKPKG